MRNTFFDLDQDSTINSMLSTPDLRNARQPATSLLTWTILLGCIALVLLFV